jgi:hypothetical protein
MINVVVVASVPFEAVVASAPSELVEGASDDDDDDEDYVYSENDDRNEDDEDEGLELDRFEYESAMPPPEQSFNMWEREWEVGQRPGVCEVSSFPSRPPFLGPPTFFDHRQGSVHGFYDRNTGPSSSVSGLGRMGGTIRLKTVAEIMTTALGGIIKQPAFRDAALDAYHRWEEIHFETIRFYILDSVDSERDVRLKQTRGLKPELEASQQSFAVPNYNNLERKELIGPEVLDTRLPSLAMLQRSAHAPIPPPPLRSSTEDAATDTSRGGTSQAPKSNTARHGSGPGLKPSLEQERIDNRKAVQSNDKQPLAVAVLGPQHQAPSSTNFKPKAGSSTGKAQLGDEEHHFWRAVLGWITCRRCFRS